MAIIIPSKNIYEVQNPKVRDNVIDRIEVNATEVVPNNEYETPVYNTNQTINQVSANSDIDENLSAPTNATSGGGATAKILSVAYVAYNDKKTYDFTVDIPILQSNKYISNLILGKDKDGNPNIKYALYGKEETGTATGIWKIKSSAIGFTVIKGDITYSTPSAISGEGALEIKKELVLMEDTYTPSITAKANTTLEDIGTLADINYPTKIEKDGKEYYRISGNIMCGVRTVGIKGASGWNSASGNTEPTTISLSGNYVRYVPTSIEITIYGNTIGIDLTDKTVYINGETAKKVHSVDGNELMQTTNYREFNRSWEMVQDTDYKIITNSGEIAPLALKITTTISFINDDAISAKKTVSYRVSGVYYSQIVGEGVDIFSFEGLATRISISATLNRKLYSIKSMYGGTQEEYARGKETATIRCSIADYYDESGNKVIAIDNSTKKMFFEEGDQVIPMVYGADGQDHAMSLYKNGSPKVFNVLGSKIYYDGAVWQELSLQEVDKTKSV